MKIERNNKEYEIYRWCPTRWRDIPEELQKDYAVMGGFNREDVDPDSFYNPYSWMGPQLRNGESNTE